MNINFTVFKLNSERRSRLSTYHHMEMALLSYKFRRQEASSRSETPRMQSQVPWLSVEGVGVGVGWGDRATPTGFPYFCPAFYRPPSPSRTHISGQCLRGCLLPFPGLGSRPRLFNEVP